MGKKKKLKKKLKKTKKKLKKAEEEIEALQKEASKKDEMVPRQTNGLTVETAPQIEHELAKRIQNGLDNKTAKTGTPVESLKGAAKKTTQLSNIGREFPEGRGNDMQKGIAALRLHAEAAGMNQANNQVSDRPKD